MAPMQWHDASVSGGTLTAGQEPDVSQVIGQFDMADHFGPATAVPATAVPATGVPATAVPAMGVPASALPALPAEPALPALPVGLDLPCAENPELFFAESPSDLEQAKAMCWGCRARVACLTGALERREPWGVWGGELLMRGAIVPRKRPRGRPRKSENTEVAA
jgi:WhiB family transcriptional regulator, redox-sensing transcriptional regulator